MCARFPPPERNVLMQLAKSVQAAMRAPTK